MTAIDWSSVVDGTCVRCRIDVQWHTTSPLALVATVRRVRQPEGVHTTMSETFTTETAATERAALLTRWEAPVWATSSQQDTETIRWVRKATTVGVRIPQNATEKANPVTVDVEVAQHDWVAIGPAGVSVERDRPELWVAGEPMTLEEGRKIASAILEVCDAVEQP